MSYENLLRILFTPYLVSLYLCVILPQFDLKRLLLSMILKLRFSWFGVLPLGTCPTCWYPLLLIYYELVLHVGIFSRSIIQFDIFFLQYTTSWVVSSLGIRRNSSIGKHIPPCCLGVSHLGSYFFLCANL